VRDTYGALMDDIASGAVTYLSQSEQVLSLVGFIPASDPNPDNIGVPFIFRETPLYTLTGTQSSMIVCSNAGSWGAPVPYATSRFPRLSVEIYTDPLRDSSLNWTEMSADTVRRTEELFSVVHGYLQRRDAAPVFFGDLLTVQCSLLAEGQTSMWSDTDGTQHKQVFYAVETIGFLDVAV
jgi:hypothetical protein